MGNDSRQGFRRDIVVAFVPTARLIARQAARQLGRPEDADEFIGAALEGLVDAGNRYDERRGVPFPAFAKHRVRGAIMDSVRSRDFVPRSARTRARVIEGATRNFLARRGRPPTVVELAGTLGLTVADTHTLVRKAEAKPMLSLSAPLPDGSQAEELKGDQADVLSALVRGQQREALRVALRALPERERIAVALFYIEERPLKSIGVLLGVSPSRVSQLCSQAIRRLRVSLIGHQP